MSSHSKNLNGILILILLALLTACSPKPQVPTATLQAIQHIQREAVLAEPEKVAKMLTDPSQSQDGVISMLASLGIGVYTPDGQQILQGSERRDTDFFLYDFELPLLAAMAGGPTQPFSDLHAVLAREGYKGTASDLSLAFASAFRQHPEGFIPRLFAALGVSADQPDITPLESWLLLLSTLPPNQASSPVTMNLLAQSGPGISRCAGIITKSGVQPFWFVTEEPWVEDMRFQAAEDLYYAIQGPILAQAVFGTLTVDPTSVHEGHGGPGNSTKFTVNMTVNFLPQSVSLGACGTLMNIIKPAYPPIRPVQLDWRVSPGLTDRGTLNEPPGGSWTDDNGQAVITFTAQTEASGGQGSEQSLTDEVFVTLPAKDVFQWSLGISDPRLLVFVPNQIPLRDSLTITWHELEPTTAPDCISGIPAGDYTGTLVYTSILPDHPPLHDGSGKIHFFVDSSGNVDGTWDLAYAVKSFTGLTGTGNVSDGVVSGTANKLQLSGTVVTAMDKLGPGPAVPWPYTLLTVETVCSIQVVASFKDGTTTVIVHATPFGLEVNTPSP